MKDAFTSTKSPCNNSRLVRKVLILTFLVACTALISSESPASAATASCYELQTDFSNAEMAYSEAYRACHIDNPPSCGAYGPAESALFSASSALAGTCAMEQPEFCPGAYDRAAQCNAQWDYSGIEDQEYHDYVYNQYMACMAASGIYTCV